MLVVFCCYDDPPCSHSDYFMHSDALCVKLVTVVYIHNHVACILPF